MYDVEIEEKPQRLVGEAEVGQELGLVNWQESVHAFQFDYNQVFDQEIKSVA